MEWAIAIISASADARQQYKKSDGERNRINFCIAWR